MTHTCALCSSAKHGMQITKFTYLRLNLEHDNFTHRRRRVAAALVIKFSGTGGEEYYYNPFLVVIVSSSIFRDCQNIFFDTENATSEFLDSVVLLSEGINSPESELTSFCLTTRTS